MARNIVAGNWKMNLLKEEAISLITDLKQLNNSKAELIICTPFVYLEKANTLLVDSSINLGAQDCSTEKSGAFTAEISSEMISSIGAQYIIIGHSERRQYHGETNQSANKKIKNTIESNLKAIYCIGEVLVERESKTYKDVIKKQIAEGLSDISLDDMSHVVLAYEPVWAIGTGKTASPEQAQEIHAFIRDLIKELYNSEIAEKTSILYGGSCKPNNAKEIFEKKDVNGGLIGGASLNAKDFIDIANSF
jgi:triosephosphate isomerase